METRILVQAVRRNQARFPEDFMFQVTGEEHEALRSQIVISTEKQELDDFGYRAAIFRGRSVIATTIHVMRMVDETLIAEAGRRLAAAAPDAQVILFGSHARGEASPHSDVDFLVVEPEVANEAEESVRLRRALRGLRLPVDIIVVGSRYAEDWANARGSLVHAALSQGRVLAG